MCMGVLFAHVSVHIRRPEESVRSPKLELVVSIHVSAGIQTQDSLEEQP